MSKIIKQQGFAMLEVLLAIVVVAMVSFGVYSLYRTAAGGGATQQTEQAIQQVSSAALQLINSSFGNVPDAVDVWNSGGLASTYKASDCDTSSSACFVGPWGAISYDEYSTTSGTNQAFTITVAGVPGDTAAQFCRDMVSSYDVELGSEPLVSEGSTGTTCAEASYDSVNKFTLYYPRGVSASSTGG